ncbi:histidinol-phosphate transaminase [Aliamphritea spongicola]|uniref:histidinol-phosphate transaminase n=1 Tax=Aliamphritea spongicola TaxID=707589 RepID=UPI00196AE1DB|nr:histidinol-phosphate transaminase [Aliamphritea spongicola]MBN3561709.1 histidinol-phosphate transaminase [Aliamphritea spongicola]
MSKYWSPAINSLTPYVPGEQPKQSGLIKLNTNENPYPPSPHAIAALNDYPKERLKLYCDPEATLLKNALKDYFSLDYKNVFVGNGSDEVLALAFMAFFRQEHPILLPETTYSFYDVYCNLYDIAYTQLPLDQDFNIDLKAYEQPNGGIIFANPNAPTGRVLPLEQIEALLKVNTESLVIVDEAYIDFGGESAVELVRKYDNVLVIQTFSKSRSMAGLRVGYALGHEDLIDGLERVKNSFNSYPLDSLAIAGAVASIEDEAYFQATTQKIINSREWTTAQLEALDFNVIPSASNFVFASHQRIAGADLMTYLRGKNLLVRHFKKPGIENYLRISIGTDEEMTALVNALKDYPGITG